MPPCFSFVCWCRRFWGASHVPPCSDSNPKDRGNSWKASVPTYHTTVWCHNPEAETMNANCSFTCCFIWMWSLTYDPKKERLRIVCMDTGHNSACELDPKTRTQIEDAWNKEVLFTDRTITPAMKNDPIEVNCKTPSEDRKIPLLMEQKIHYVAAIKSERQWNKAKAT
jgi:hypothetical protein